MPASANSLFARGAISSKALTRMKGSAKMGLKGKVVDFDNKTKDEAGTRGPNGVALVEGIQKREYQRADAPGLAGAPTQAKGGKQRGGQPKTAHIDQEQGPEYPAGAKIKASNKGKVGVKGGTHRDSGPMYGGPNNNRGA